MTKQTLIRYRQDTIQNLRNIKFWIWSLRKLIQKLLDNLDAIMDEMNKRILEEQQEIEELNGKK